MVLIGGPRPTLLSIFGDQLISFRVFDDLEGKVHVKGRPVEMLAVQQLDVADLPEGGILEPGEVLEGQEILPALEKDTKAVLENVRNLRLHSASAMLTSIIVVGREGIGCCLGDLAFHLLISHLRNVGLVARMFDRHIHEVAVRVQIEIYILVYLFRHRHLTVRELNQSSIGVCEVFDSHNVTPENYDQRRHYARLRRREA